jgi:mercuric ion transport protein
MLPLADRARRVLPSGLAGLAGLACAACCAIPLLLAGGALSGAAWAAAAWIPGIAVALAALAGAAWWWARRRRRHQATCAGDASCACGGS